MVASHPIRVMCRRRHKNARRTGAASHKSDTRILTTKSPVARFAGNYATAMRTSFGSSRFPMAKSVHSGEWPPPASHYNRAGLGFASGLGLTIRNLRFPSSKPRVLKSGSGGARTAIVRIGMGVAARTLSRKTLAGVYQRGVSRHALLVSAVRPDRDPDDVTCNTPPAARADPDFLHEEAGVAKSVRKIFIRFR